MRYYLNIRNGDMLIADLEGADYPSLDEARQEAVRSARELLSEMVRRGEVVNGRSIEICDEEGRILETIRLREQFRLP